MGWEGTFIMSISNTQSLSEPEYVEIESAFGIDDPLFAIV